MKISNMENEIDKGILSFIEWVIKKELDFSMGDETGSSIEEQAEDLLKEYKQETA